MHLLFLLICTQGCLLEWDPALDSDGFVVPLYQVVVVETGEVCREVPDEYLDIRETDCDRDGSYQLAIRAVDDDGLVSEELSNPVWFNKSCLEHTGETVNHGEWEEVLGCERECCEGCYRELRQRYPACLPSPPSIEKESTDAQQDPS